MNNTAYYNGVKMTVEEVEKRHTIKSKAVLGLPLTAYERSLYLLYIATTQEASEFLKREKGGNL